MVLSSSPLSEYSLGNFKAFGDVQKIGLKPITLLYGKNSSGKSSIIHSLLFLHELLQTNEFKDIHKTTLGEDFVDLGGFTNFAHGKPDFPAIDGRFGPTLSFSFSVTDPSIENFPDWDVEFRIAASREHGSLKIVLDELNLSNDGQDVLSVKSPKKNDDSILYPLVFEKDSDWFSQNSSEIEDLDQFLDGFMLKHTAQNASFLNFQILTPDDYQIFCTTPDDADQFETSIDTWDIIKNKASKLIESVFGKVDEVLSGIKYLGGLRTMPHKAFFDGGSSKHDNPLSGGISYWEKIRDDDHTFNKVNEWLKLLFELESSEELDEESKKLGKYQIIRQKILDQNSVEKALGKVEDDQALLENLRDLFSEEANFTDETDQLDGVRDFVLNCLEKVSGVRSLRIRQNGAQSVDLTAGELGVGVGQVIPLLGAAAGLYDQTILIEQPEIHLHPKQQADLGQVFAQSAKDNNNRFIIETHSIHILERLGKIIREVSNGDLHRGISIKTEDIGIYFVKPDGDGVTLLEIELGANGKTKLGWPDGFFNVWMICFNKR